MSRPRGSTVIIAAGSLLLITAASHHAREAASLGERLGPALALLLDGGLSACLIYAGAWLRRGGLSADEEWSVGVWAVLGGIVGSAIAGLTIAVEVVEGRALVEPQFRLLISASGGALVLFIAGYYAAQQRVFNRRYKTLFDNTVQFTGLLSLDGEVIEVNETALEFGGLTRDEVVGKQFDATWWWTHSERVRDRIRAALERVADGESVRFETEARGADGLRIIEFSARPVTGGSGDIKRIIVNGYDVTEKRRQREHLQVLHRLVRHNMRNDLMKVGGWTREAATAASRSERISHAGRVDRILRSWEEIADGLKEIQGVIESKHGQLDYEPAEKLVSEVIESQRSLHPEAEISLARQTSTTRVVPRYVETAVDEAIDNAIAASASDTPTVNVTVSDADGGWTTIAIDDDGPGMPEAEASVLETGLETPLTHGSGIGVWKIRVATKQAGGDITVDRDGIGTEIRLRLPDKRETQAPPASA